MTTSEVVELTPAQIYAHDDQRDLGEAGYATLAHAYRQVFMGATRLLDAGGGSGAAVPALSGAAALSGRRAPNAAGATEATWGE